MDASRSPVSQQRHHNNELQHHSRSGRQQEGGGGAGLGRRAPVLRAVPVTSTQFSARKTMARKNTKKWRCGEGKSKKEAGNARCDRECGSLTKRCVRQSLAVPAARVSLHVHAKMAGNSRAAASCGTELEAIAILLAVAAAGVSVEGIHVACRRECGTRC